MLSIKLKTTKKDGRIFAHVYNKGEKMSFKGTSFSINTPMKIILDWAHKPANQEINIF